MKYKYCLDVQVCSKIGVVSPFYLKRNSCPKIKSSCSGQEFHGIVDYFIDKEMADSSEFNTNLIVQAVCFHAFQALGYLLQAFLHFSSLDFRDFQFNAV